MLNSIKRYTSRDYVTLGEIINDEGFESLGNIKRTNAYLISKASLQEKELISNRMVNKVKQNESNKPKIKR